MNSPQETSAIETGRMELPALVIHTVKGEPVSCDIVRSDSDGWIGSYPVGKLDVHTHVISISTVLRAQAMERALKRNLDRMERRYIQAELEGNPIPMCARDTLYHATLEALDMKSISSTSDKA